MLVAGRLRHIASTKWGKRRYLVMDHLLNPEAGGGGRSMKPSAARPSAGQTALRFPKLKDEGNHGRATDQESAKESLHYRLARSPAGSVGAHPQKTCATSMG
jgi:hypothetical protein